MVYEENTIRQLYKRLLALYPRAFKERLGESWTGALIDQMPCFLGVPNCD